MGEPQAMRVQAVPGIAGQAGVRKQGAACPVHRIAGQWMPGRGHVDADLVGPAGGNRDLHQRVPVAQGQHAHV
jgi:hypothetical protein